MVHSIILDIRQLIAACTHRDRRLRANIMIGRRKGLAPASLCGQLGRGAEARRRVLPDAGGFEASIKACLTILVSTPRFEQLTAQKWIGWRAGHTRNVDFETSMPNSASDAVRSLVRTCNQGELIGLTKP